MQRVTQLSEDKRRLLRVVAIAAFVGLVSGGLATGTIGLLPPKLKSSELQVAAASTHVLVDTGPTSIVHRRDYPPTALAKRAELLGRVITSPPVLERIARISGISADQIGASARSTANVPLALSEPGSEQRANEILRSAPPYRIEIQARETNPVFSIYTQAPSTAEAEGIANAAVAGLRDYLRDLGDRQGFGDYEPVRVRQLGRARGGPVNGGAQWAIALLAFGVAFSFSCAVGLFVLRRRGFRLPVRRPAAQRESGDDWPHTGRLLPWMLALFIAILWLAPFDQIELSANLPIDLKLDRLVLPFVAVTWALALVAEGRVVPRGRLTWIHAAVGAFVWCAFLSVVLDARYLNHTLELEGSLKELPLLVSYVSLFLIAASAVRRTEIQAFLTYTLVLAVLCAIGIIIEYRFEVNLFFDWSDKILPGIFKVAELDASAVDTIGRRQVQGPAGVPLEAVAMLSMALPIALVGIMQAKRWRGRVLYGLAACLLLAATFATFRKSALLAPVSVILTVAYFRRQELLKLAPLGLVLVLLVHLIAPGALGSTTQQFDPGRLGVTTVSERTADYDAVRPDVWTHLPFGRGWGSYDHASYRILDTELLHRLIEMGVVGLLAFLFMGASVVLSARATIASRHPSRAPIALIGAAAAVSFLVVSTLFDVLSFPHATYIFLYMAGLVAALIGYQREPDETGREHLHGSPERRAPGASQHAPTEVAAAQPAG
jgi:hypothetical protein